MLPGRSACLAAMLDKHVEQGTRSAPAIADDCLGFLARRGRPRRERLEALQATRQCTYVPVHASGTDGGGV